MRPCSDRPAFALDVQFRHMPKLHALQQAARQQFESFVRLAPNGARCHVIFNRSRSSQHGPVYQTGIRLHIPGRPLYVTHSEEADGSHDILFAALNNAFNDLRRKVQKHSSRRHTARRRPIKPTLQHCNPV